MAKNKTASSKSKFDFKKFLLEKGEKVGLIIAGVGFGLLALFGVMAAAKAENPGRITTEFKSGIDNVDAKLRETPEQPPPVKIPDTKDVFVTVKPTDYPTKNELFGTAGTISEKRTNPTLLALIEGVAKYQIGGFGVVMVNNDQVAVVRGRVSDARNDVRPLRQKGKGKDAPNPGNQGAPVPAPVPTAPFMPKGAMPKGANPAGIGKLSELEIVYVPVDSEEAKNAVYAVNLRPVRMARIQGVIPYKAQVAKYLSALRLENDTQLVGEHSEPTYRGFNVERLVLAADGKTVVKDWTPFDHVDAIKTFQEPTPGTRLLFAAYESIDHIKDFIPEPVHRLFMKAPLLAHGAYEPVQLNTLGQAMQELAKSGPPKVLSGKEKAIRNQGDPFDPDPLVNQQQVGGSAGPTIIPGKGGPPIGGGGLIPRRGGEPRGGGVAVANRTNAAPVWLLQFIDPTIEAGYCYKYRVQLKAANPNFGKRDLVAFPGLAAQEELVSEWFEIPDIVFAPPEEYIYAVGEKMKERAGYGSAEYDTTIVRYHRWYDYVRVTRDGGIPDPVGEWVVADLLAKRGQYIHESEKMFRLPLWSMVAGAYTFRDLISRTGGNLINRIKGENVKMDFRPITDVLLVDFDGGSGVFRLPQGGAVKDECQAEILLITDDGKTLKVTAQNTVTDKADQARMARETSWLKWLEEVRTASEKQNNAAGPPGKGG